ncbi:Bug family tripartite tricarboxylate transporter substrate binding protein [Tropicimonas isoalkanivorans]|uniref:Tripartite-type tricarboxylate transporter, receptor component TctC n=1 Tax=Tropicimonas isoalkanivorans TaxID=441112 RepID=A0A1I1MPM2_9RHOB|nr:tripartite tricarboxylate transporter substrate binding protein [Tropicimonas isoalkanivorans]SFC87075.1 Tripartite-type tricarboxylate transporter, receptor component TctC [Tropicimonas isoalkanivorans]
MKTQTYRILVATAGLAAFAGASGALADDYPSRPVSLIVGFAPGGPADTLARIVAKEMNADLGQPVVVENKPGAGSTIAAREVAKADPDGYTILFVTSGHAGNFSYYPNLDFEASDLTGVAGIASTPIVITTGPDSPFTSLGDLIEAAKADPETLTYAAGGGGATLTALSAATFLDKADISAIPVSYGGSGPQNVDLMGGVLDFAFDTVSGSAALIQNDQIKALAVTSDKRSDVLPDVPTVTESGLDNFDQILGWFGMLAPAGTDPEIIATLNGAVVSALESEAVLTQLSSQGLEPMKMDPEEFDAWLVSETDRWGGLIKSLGLSAE